MCDYWSRAGWKNLAHLNDTIWKIWKNGKMFVIIFNNICIVCSNVNELEISNIRICINIILNITNLFGNRRDSDVHWESRLVGRPPSACDISIDTKTTS